MFSLQKIFSFSNLVSHQRRSPSSMVSNIIKKQTEDQNYVYRQTHNICNIIKSMFEDVAKDKELSNLSELKRLTRSIHLSSFASWKALNSTAKTIHLVINDVFIMKQIKLSSANFIELSQILDSLNYQISENNDKKFIEGQIFSKIKSQDFSLNTSQSARILQALFRQPLSFQIYESEKQKLQSNISQKIFLQNQKKYDDLPILNLIRNGLYQSFWTNEFLQATEKYIDSQKKTENKYKGLLNAMKLSTKSTNSVQEDQWTLNEVQKQQSESNFVTQTKILNILRNLDYDVETNRCIFGFEVDFKIEPQFIIEYHGIHHYLTNSERPIQTMRSSWKVNCLKKRGYTVCIIPFYQWNKLETIYEKKAWLINHIQRQLFKS